MAPAPNEITPPTCVAERKKAEGARVLRLSRESLGAFLRPVAHRKPTYGSPKNSSMVADIHGVGSAVSTSLLPMLYATLSTYQSVNRNNSFKVRFEKNDESSTSTEQYSALFGSYASHDPGSRPSAAAAETSGTGTASGMSSEPSSGAVAAAMRARGLPGNCVLGCSRTVRRPARTTGDDFLGAAKASHRTSSSAATHRRAVRPRSARATGDAELRRAAERL
mmetsp:Transcript_16033/g.25626  ORF Transcript_16033/g.25626 Transcript_16033/m.25626 type:complete len:222 (+) Transcript_16033:361-1026(+)